MKLIIYQITVWDLLLLNRIFGLETSPRFATLIKLLTRSADGHLYPFVAALLLLGGTPWATDFLVSALIAFSIELPAYRFLKNRIRRPRPFETVPGLIKRIIPPDQFSFPSGHTAAAFVFATLLSHFEPIVMPFVLLWAGGVAFSRVYLGVHYPTDTLAGAVAGIVCASIGLWVVL